MNSVRHVAIAQRKTIVLVHDGLAESFHLVRETRAVSAEVKRFLGTSTRSSIPWRHQHDNTASLSQLAALMGHTLTTGASTTSHFDEVAPLLLGVQRFVESDLLFYFIGTINNTPQCDAPCLSGADGCLASDVVTNLASDVVTNLAHRYVNAPHSLQLAPLHRSALAKDLDTAVEFLGGWESMHEEDFAKISEMAKLYIDDLVEKARGSLDTVIEAMHRPDPQARMRDRVRTGLLKAKAFERYGKLTSSIERLVAVSLDHACPDTLSPRALWPARVGRSSSVAVQQSAALFQVFQDGCSIMPQFSSFLTDLTLATTTSYQTSGLQPWLNCVLSTQRKEWVASALTPVEGCIQIPDFDSGQVCAGCGIVMWRRWLWCGCGCGLAGFGWDRVLSSLRVLTACRPVLACRCCSN